MGALGEHEGVCAPDTHSPSSCSSSQQQPQGNAAQRGDFDATATGRHEEEGGKQRHGGDHEPHLWREEIREECVLSNTDGTVTVKKDSNRSETGEQQLVRPPRRCRCRNKLTDALHV
ncbi:hypothetical protein EYF80_011037 [Liparis tanakae]|uniref:Uncharacterized protein n=1 Tax=Liparis tanakae TaxID=230148 RepID=A0A4Z2IM78_9TELE|nr:hypothetical protein EYF80_011037 [Liparis tanakae]